MVDIVVPYDPDRSARQMPAVLLDEYGDQAGLTANPFRVSGELVAMPFRKGLYKNGANGSAAAPGVGAGIPENNDGTQTGVFVSVAASATWANWASFGFWVMERVVGLRVLRDATYGGSPLGCTIDGVAYDVDTEALLTPAGQSSSNTAAGEGGQILASDLEDRPHYVELTFSGATSGTRLWVVMGFIAEAKYYRLPSRGMNFSYSAPTALTGGWSTMNPVNINAYGFRKVLFYNPTGGSVTAQVRYSSGNGVIWAKPVPAGDTVEFDPGGPIYHTVDVTGNGLMASGIGAQ